MTDDSRWRHWIDEWILWFLFSATVLGCFFSITVAEFGLALLFLYILLSHPRLFHEVLLRIPSRFWFWYSAFLFWSVLAVVSALDVKRSISDARDMFLYLTPLALGAIFIRFGEKAYRVFLYSVIIGGGVNALIGLYQFVWVHEFSLEMRIQGLQAHYITFSGLLMIALLFSAGFSEFYHPKKRWLWNSIAFLLGVTLLVSLTRSVWVGAGIGLVVLGLLYGWRMFLRYTLFGILIIAIAFIIAPDQIVSRVKSFLKPSMASNQTRLWLLQASLPLILDYPLFGIGPDNWVHVYENYRLPEMPIEEIPVHLHNNYAQIAMERGLPGLFFWLGWYLFVLFAVHRLFSLDRRTEHRWKYSVTIAVWIALGVAGFFDYNFGDSEIAILWLTLPAFAMLSYSGPLNPKENSKKDLSHQETEIAEVDEAVH